MLVNRDNFYKVAPFYEQNALVQKLMADNLIDFVKSHLGDSFNKIFEIGCGTGLLTRIVQEKLKYQDLILNDLKNFVFTNKEYHFIKGDIEDIEISEKFDLILSNATFQWVKKLDQLFDKLSYSLYERGFLAFTTFGKDNLKEIKSITGVGLDYIDIDSYLSLLEKRFNIIMYKEEIVQLYFENPANILKHIKFTGVNSIKKVQWTKRDYFNFCKDYDEFKTEKGYLLTYNPFYFIVVKK